MKIVSTITGISLALTSVLAVPELNLALPSADEGTGLYLRFSKSEYKNYFGSYWDAGTGATYLDMGVFLGKPVSQGFAIVSKLNVQIEGQEAVKGDIWGLHKYAGSSMNGDVMTLYAGQMPWFNMQGSLEPQMDSNPFLYVKSGEQLIVGQPYNQQHGIDFTWKQYGSQNRLTLDSVVKVRVDGNLLSNIKLNQDNSQEGKVYLEMKLGRDSMYAGSIMLENYTPNTTMSLNLSKHRDQLFQEVWSANNKANKIDVQAIDTYDNSVASFLTIANGRNSSTMVNFGSSANGGSEVALHTKGSATDITGVNRQKVLAINSDSRNFTIGTLGVETGGTIIYNSNGATINRIFFGTWSQAKGFEFEGSTGHSLVSIFTKGDLDIRNVEGGNRQSIIDVSDDSGSQFHYRKNVQNHTYTLGVANGTTINLYGTSNEFDRVYLTNKTSSNVKFINQTSAKTITGIKTLDAGAIKGNMTAELTARANGSDIFYIQGVSGVASNNITIIPKIGSQDDRKGVIGQVIGYTPNSKTTGTANVNTDITWKPTDGILNGTFKITLASEAEGSYLKWKIKDYILDGVDNVEKPEPPVEPEKPVDPKPPVEGGDGNGEVKPPVEGGDGGTKPPTDGGDNGNGENKPPVIDTPDEKPNNPDTGKPENPDTKPPVEKPEEKPDVKPEVPTEKPQGVFTETFVRSMSKKVGDTKNLFLANFNSINKRLGEVRNNEAEHGVWGRVFVGAYEGSTFFTLQAGYDNQLLKTKDYSLYVGGAVAYSKDDITNLGEVAGYMSYVQDSGWYNDAILKAVFMKSSSVASSFNHNGVMLSDEVGYRFVFGEKENWYIDPQVELSVGYLSGATFTDMYNGSPVIASFSDTVHFRSRLGASFGYKHLFEESKIKAQAYLGLFGEFDNFSKSSGKVNAYQLIENYGSAYKDDARMVLNVGANVDLKDNGRVYFDFEKSFFGKFTIDWKINLGYRYAFGEKKVKVEEKPEAPVKLKDETKGGKGVKGDKVSKKGDKVKTAKKSKGVKKEAK